MNNAGQTQLGPKVQPKSNPMGELAAALGYDKLKLEQQAQILCMGKAESKALAHITARCGDISTLSNPFGSLIRSQSDFINGYYPLLTSHHTPRSALRSPCR
jgi:hypothetical protein